MNRFDWQQHLRETAQHLVTLADTPGFNKYAAGRLDELEPKPGEGMYAGLREEIVRQRSASTSAPAAGSTPASTGVPGAGA